MNKRDFTKELAKRAGIPKTKATGITNAALDILTEAMAKKEWARLVSYGSFETRYTPQRLARNLKTRETVVIPAGDTPISRASASPRGKVNEE